MFVAYCLFDAIAGHTYNLIPCTFVPGVVATYQLSIYYESCGANSDELQLQTIPEPVRLQHKVCFRFDSALSNYQSFDRVFGLKTQAVVV